MVLSVIHLGKIPIFSKLLYKEIAMSSQKRLKLQSVLNYQSISKRRQFLNKGVKPIPMKAILLSSLCGSTVLGESTELEIKEVSQDTNNIPGGTFKKSNWGFERWSRVKERRKLINLNDLNIQPSSIDFFFLHWTNPTYLFEALANDYFWGSSTKSNILIVTKAWDYILFLLN